MTIRKALERIAKDEGLTTKPETIETIADNAGGDLRAALNDLQAGGISQREREKDIFDLVRTIFKAEKYADVKQALRGDIDYEIIKLWIDENIPLEYDGALD